MVLILVLILFLILSLFIYVVYLTKENFKMERIINELDYENTLLRKERLKKCRTKK